MTAKDRKGFQIRARVQQDIENALDIIDDEDLKFTKTTQADYLYRIFLSKEQLVKFMNHIVLHIDYSNFKDRIHKKADQKNKVELYYSVWATMNRIQQ